MSKHFIQQPLGKTSRLTAEEWGIPEVTTWPRWMGHLFRECHALKDITQCKAPAEFFFHFSYDAQWLSHEENEKMKMEK
jgi:hypothetical protein